MSQDYSGARIIQDLSEIEKRKDILVYITEELPNEVEVTGHILLKLFISTDVVNSDFVCKLIDIYPDGKRYAVSSSVLRVRYRNSLKPEFLEEGEVYELCVDMGTTSNVFLKGHRIGVEIASSSFPNIDRNLNTGARIGAGSDYVIAHHKIYHNNQYTSKLILPIIPIEDK